MLVKGSNVKCIFLLKPDLPVGRMFFSSIHKPETIDFVSMVS
jgi:hypothetical protein